MSHKSQKKIKTYRMIKKSTEYDRRVKHKANIRKRRVAQLNKQQIDRRDKDKVAKAVAKAVTGHICFDV